MDWGNVLIILIVVLMIFGSAKNDVNKNRKYWNMQDVLLEGC